MESVTVVEADLGRPEHQAAIVALTDAYAQDAMGGGTPLTEAVRRDLVPALRQHPTTLVFLAYHEGKAVGIATCFIGFSTFVAQRLINIHDLAVVPSYRGRGVGRRLLGAVEQKARDLGCCKVTLEVLDANAVARRLYEAEGFEGGFHFLAKTL
jgi:GNAT superfamily N-acetyltransferase